MPKGGAVCKAAEPKKEDSLWLSSFLESVNTFAVQAFRSAPQPNREPSTAVRGWRGGAAE